jgi:hypothetical protein
MAAPIDFNRWLIADIHPAAPAGECSGKFTANAQINFSLRDFFQTKAKVLIKAIQPSTRVCDNAPEAQARISMRRF